MASETDDDGRSWVRDPRVVVARRDLTSLSREKTIVLALLIQLFVAAFSSFLVFGLSSLYDPGSVDAQGVVVGVSGEATDELIAASENVSGVTPVAYDSQAAARSAFREEARVHALVHGTYEPASDGDGTVIRATATAPESSVRSTLVVVQLRAVLEELERTERIERLGPDEQPLRLPDPVDASQYYGFTYTVLLPLLLFLPPFISGSVAVDGVTEEMERGTLELLRVAPVDLVDVVDGKALAMIAIAPAQAALWILLLGFNGIPVANPLALLTFVGAIAAVVVALGSWLGLQFGRRRPAQLLYSVLALVLFALAVFAPEHPATTAARLAVDSPGPWTLAHVAGAVVLAAVVYAAMRRSVGDVDPESL